MMGIKSWFRYAAIDLRCQKGATKGKMGTKKKDLGYQKLHELRNRTKRCEDNEKGRDRCHHLERTTNRCAVKAEVAKMRCAQTEVIILHSYIVVKGSLRKWDKIMCTSLRRRY
jgi:hypothetical protein